MEITIVLSLIGVIVSAALVVFEVFYHQLYNQRMQGVPGGKPREFWRDTGVLSVISLGLGILALGFGLDFIVLFGSFQMSCVLVALIVGVHHAIKVWRWRDEDRAWVAQSIQNYHPQQDQLTERRH